MKVLLHTSSKLQETSPKGWKFQYQPILNFEKVPFEWPIDEPEFIILTSIRTIDFLQSLPDWASKIPLEIPCFVIGEKSLPLLQKLGFDNIKSGFKSFLDMIPDLSKHQYGWFLGAKELTKGAESWLKQARCEHLPMYQSIFIGDQFLLCPHHDISVTVATSPKMIDGLYRLGLAKTCPMVVLGQTSFVKAKELGFQNVQIASKPDIQVAMKTAMDWIDLETRL